MNGEASNNLLHRLPNGAWIDLANVMAIRVLPPTSVAEGDFDQRVTVHWGGGFIEVCTPPDVLAFVDELAAMVNEAKSSEVIAAMGVER